MKTSVIEVRDMLSVLSVQGVEERIGDVPGVQSATVNFAAASATVRYDETRLTIADIRSAVRQSGYESDASDTSDSASAVIGHEGHAAPGAPPAPDASTPPKASKDATVPAGVAPSTAPKPSPGVPATAPAAKPEAPKPAPDAAPKGDAAAPAKS